MRRLCVILAFICLISISNAEEFLKPIGETDVTIRAVTDVTLENLLNALKSGNKQAFVSYFNATNRTRLINGDFEAMRKTFEKEYKVISSPTYLGYVNGVDKTRAIYKVYSEGHHAEKQITMELTNYIIETTSGASSTTYLTYFMIE